MHVVVATCAHRGDDARIVHRQARSLLEAGHRVTLVAPLPPPASLAADPDGLGRVAVPRARGRRRLRAWRATRTAVGRLLDDADVLLLHDPELLVLFARRSSPVPVVWDVHEDYVASIPDRRYVPQFARRPLRRAVEAIERRAVERCHLVLAEDAYADRLGPHPVVPNGTWVPEERAPLDPDVSAATALPRLVYAGRLSVGRGARELVRLGDRLAGRVRVELIGDADDDVRDLLTGADADGAVTWHGYLPNPVALGRVRGAFAGLSLLRDEPNYVHSRPTKLVEYLAQGVPVISTALPLAEDLVEASGGGVVVRSGSVDASGTDRGLVDAVARAVEDWLEHPGRRDHCADVGHAYVAEHFAWQRDGQRFVDLLEQWAGAPRPA